MVVGNVELLKAAKAAALQSEPDLTCSLQLPGLSHTNQHVHFGHKTCSLHHLQISYASRMDLALIFDW